MSGGVEGVEEQLTAAAVCVQSGDADTQRQPCHATPRCGCADVAGVLVSTGWASR